VLYSYNKTNEMH